MQNQRTTARQFEALKAPAGGRATLTDSEVPGLTLRATPGAKTWSFLTRVNGEKRRWQIGPYGNREDRGEFDLARARDEARRLRALSREGRDPVREAEAEKRQHQIEAAAVVTVAECIGGYAAIHLRQNLRTAGERERQLRSALAPHLDRPVADLTSIDLQRIIDAKATTTSAATANRIRAALVHFAKWCWLRGHLPEHIGAKTTKAGKEKPRDRVLSLDEVRAIYAATFDLLPVWGAMYRLLILTGQRRSDITLMEWTDIDWQAKRYAIPGSRTKNGKPHLVHLSPPALAELAAVHEITGASPYVFTTDGSRAVRGLHHVNPVLYEKSGVPDWRPHDLRTAFASALCEAGESESVVDRILNHSATGSAPSAVARIYNRAENLPQRAAALDRWAEMVTGERGVVVDLHRGRADG